MKLSKTWTTVTPLSKTLALILVIALPFIGFWVGTQYRPASGVSPIVNKVSTPDKLIITGSILPKTVTGPEVKTLYNLIQSSPKDSGRPMNCPVIQIDKVRSYNLDFYQDSNHLMSALWENSCGGLSLTINKNDVRQVDQTFRDSLAEILGVSPDSLINPGQITNPAF